MTQNNNSRLLLGLGLEKTYGIRTVFSIEKLEIFPQDRIGLVGANGAGKSTLLAILAGEITPDAGQIRRHCTPALIRQDGEPEDLADGKNRRTLGLSDSACKSGGEKTRLSIASALSRRTPLLFADEPTTNLDLDGVETLKKELTAFPGALVLVSHDRALLDELCTVIWELENGELRSFPGNYSDWLEQKRRERDFAQFEYSQYKKEKRRLEQAMYQVREEARTMRNPPRRMSSSEWMLYKNVAATQQGHVQNRAKGLEKRLEHLEVKERPQPLPQITMALGAAHPLRAKLAVRLEGLTVRFGSRTVLNDAGFLLPTGKRTVMLGPNGSGKTTLLKALLHAWDPALLPTEPSGFVKEPRLRFPSELRIGYFSQEHETLDPEKTVLENVRSHSDKPEHEVRTILANLYLRGDDVFKKAGVLSGGERAKTMLAQLLASEANLLILDEPTNHIGLYTTEALEGLLKQWQGTLLVVTHDRRLAEAAAERLLICKDQTVTAFEGTYGEYQESLRSRERKEKKSSSTQPHRMSEEERALKETLLTMRMAELAARLSSPRKGDQPQELQREWELLNEEYQTVRRR